MIGTIVNVIAVIIGGAVGLMFNKKLPERYIEVAFNSIGLFTAVLGMMMATKSNEILLVIFSLLLGSLLGEFLKLEEGIGRIGDWIKGFMKSEEEGFTDGLITAFLLFCMGSLTIMGAIEEGLNNNPSLFYTKSLMDGFAAIALSSTLGLGVLFSVVPLLIYQGGLTLLAGSLGQWLTEPIITELSAVGGVLLLGLALDILKIKHIKVANMLPSLIFIVAMMFAFK